MSVGSKHRHRIVCLVMAGLPLYAAADVATGGMTTNETSIDELAELSIEQLGNITVTSVSR